MNAEAEHSKLYSELASWWPLLSSPADYAEEAAFHLARLTEACSHPATSLLELGCGGGNNAFHMKSSFQEVVLTDVSSGMVGVSRELNPECEHVVGDMRHLRLGRQFDCVFVHDAVAYMTTASDLEAAIQTAFEHCRPGGAALFAPDHLTETFEPSTDCGGHDGDGRALRYLQWTWDPDPADSTYVVDYAYVLRDRDGSVRTESDRHVEGLFARADWVRLLEQAGFRAEVIRFDHSELTPGSYFVFVGVKPGDDTAAAP
jgi:ubiquinone/menaquinone biosynthesis C-methylase UbiE